MRGWDNFLVWERDNSEICDKIISNKSSLKLVVKVKDDVQSLKRWVDHHKRVVGLDGLLILDNMSGSDTILEYYNSVADDVFVFRFTGHHNKVHRAHEFMALYESLKKSCLYFSFLDADELLLWSRADGTYSYSGIVDELMKYPSVNVFPGLWVENVFGFDDRFKLNCIRGIGPTHGKPIISTRINPSGMLNHNFQLPRVCYTGSIMFNAVVLHLKHVSAEQRIDANLRKLVKTGTISDVDQIDYVLNLDPRTVPMGKGGNWNARNWVTEIQAMWKKRHSPVDLNRPLGAGEMAVLPSQSFDFYNDRERKEFLDFLEPKELSSGIDLIFPAKN